MSFKAHCSLSEVSFPHQQRAHDKEGLPDRDCTLVSGNAGRQPITHPIPGARCTKDTPKCTCPPRTSLVPTTRSAVGRAHCDCQGNCVVEMSAASKGHAARSRGAGSPLFATSDFSLKQLRDCGSFQSKSTGRSGVAPSCSARRMLHATAGAQLPRPQNCNR